MSFSLRQIVQRAGGGDDIVRTSALVAAQPLIGRGSDCDIRLYDLAVELHHARLRQVDRGRVIVEAVGPATFGAGGIRAARVELSITNAPKLVFGGHVLSLSAGTAPDEIVVTVSAGQSAGVADHKDDPFLLRGALFSLRRSAWLLGLGILLVCLAVPVGIFLAGHGERRIAAAGADRQWSSGPLSPGHHFLEKDCQACHQQAFVAVRDAACLACHRPGLAQQTALRLAADVHARGSLFDPEPAGVHAAPERLDRAMPPDPQLGRRVTAWVAHAFSHPDSGCVSCHNEHVGSGKPQSGVAPAPAAPDELRGHDCKDCHAGIRQRLADTPLPDVPDWGHHPDFRPLVAVSANQTARVDLAGAQEKSGLKFTHQLHLLAGGGVARMAMTLGKARGYGAALTCANCHRPDSSGRGFLPVEMTRDCSQCHSLAFAMRGGQPQLLPHGHPEQVAAALTAFYEAAPAAPSGAGLFTRRPGVLGARPPRTATASAADRAAAVLRAAFSPGGSCYDCHTIQPPAATNPLAYGVAPVHLTTRYLPHGAFDHAVPAHHQDATGAPNCTACHKAQASAHAEDVLLPRIADCVGCHGRSKVQTPMAASSDCAECHSFHDTSRPVRGRRQEIGFKP